MRFMDSAFHPIFHHPKIINMKGTKYDKAIYLTLAAGLGSGRPFKSGYN